MQRVDIGGDERLDTLVNAIERGQEVLLTRDDTVVAEIVPAAPRNENFSLRPIDLDRLRALREQIPPAFRVQNAAALIREMREMRDARDF